MRSAPCAAAHSLHCACNCAAQWGAPAPLLRDAH